jgi:transcriptional regulator PpsR
VKQFNAARRSFGDLDADDTAKLIAAAADVALLLDQAGVVRDLAYDDTELSLDAPQSWVGRRWSEIVTVESRPKIDALLEDAAAGAPPRWRQVNHPTDGSSDFPVLYRAVRVGKEGHVVAIGRDLRAIAALQQRLVGAQQSMERDYARLRHIETRHRLLFQMSSEPTLVVDASTQKVIEANPAAARTMATTAQALVGRALADGFDGEGMLAVQALLAGVRAGGRPNTTSARLAEDGREVTVWASVFRQEQSSLHLVKLLEQPDRPAAGEPEDRKAKLLSAVEHAPDAFVLIGPDGRVQVANAAFLDLVQVTSEQQALSESLDRWLGRPGVDLSVLLANLKQHGSIRLFATTLRGEFGEPSEVEISAAAIPGPDGPCYGFAIRAVGRRLAPQQQAHHTLPRSLQQMTELVGRVPLKDLVRETTDVIERMCIEAALELTNDNRASAAEMLGLSRQSLYVKLRRYGLGDLATEDE